MTKTMPASNAALSLVPANEGLTPDSAFPGDIQDLCSLGMQRAIEIEKASLAAALHLNSCVVDSYKNALWFSPAFGDLLSTAATSFAICVELQMNWLTLLAPPAFNVATQGSSAVSGSSKKSTPPAEVLARSMDIAIGEDSATHGITVTSISGGQLQPAAEAPEPDKDIAMGAGA